MSAEKSESVILSMTPYRETSCILRLFTRGRGLIHGIAKGVRGGGKSSTPIDRGFLLEAQLYYRPNRELHTLGSLHVANFFPEIRADITKSSLRDVALELYLKSITQSEPHPELFDLIAGFLVDMEKTSRPEILFPLLWRFVYGYCVMTGFGIDTKRCKACGIDVGGSAINAAGDNTINNAADAINSEYILETEVGALVCKKCAPLKINTKINTNNGIDKAVIRFIDGTNNDFPHQYQRNENMRITELLLLYCRRHLDIRAPLNSVEFVRLMC